MDRESLTNDFKNLVDKVSCYSDQCILLHYNSETCDVIPYYTSVGEAFAKINQDFTLKFCKLCEDHYYSLGIANRMVSILNKSNRTVLIRKRQDALKAKKNYGKQTPVSCESLNLHSDESTKKRLEDVIQDRKKEAPLIDVPTLSECSENSSEGGSVICSSLSFEAQVGDGTPKYKNENADGMAKHSVEETQKEKIEESYTDGMAQHSVEETPKYKIEDTDGTAKQSVEETPKDKNEESDTDGMAHSVEETPKYKNEDTDGMAKHSIEDDDVQDQFVSFNSPPPESSCVNDIVENDGRIVQCGMSSEGAVGQSGILSDASRDDQKVFIQKYSSHSLFDMGNQGKSNQKIQLDILQDTSARKSKDSFKLAEVKVEPESWQESSETESDYNCLDTRDEVQLEIKQELLEEESADSIQITSDKVQFCSLQESPEGNICDQSIEERSQGIDTRKPLQRKTNDCELSDIGIYQDVAEVEEDMNCAASMESFGQIDDLMSDDTLPNSRPDQLVVYKIGQKVTKIVLDCYTENDVENDAENDSDETKDGGEGNKRELDFRFEESSGKLEEEDEETDFVSSDFSVNWYPLHEHSYSKNIDEKDKEKAVVPVTILSCHASEPYEYYPVLPDMQIYLPVSDAQKLSVAEDKIGELHTDKAADLFGERDYTAYEHKIDVPDVPIAEQIFNAQKLRATEQDIRESRNNKTVDHFAQHEYAMYSRNNKTVDHFAQHEYAMYENDVGIPDVTNSEQISNAQKLSVTEQGTCNRESRTNTTADKHDYTVYEHNSGMPDMHIAEQVSDAQKLSVAKQNIGDSHTDTTAELFTEHDYSSKDPEQSDSEQDESGFDESTSDVKVKVSESDKAHKNKCRIEGGRGKRNDQKKLTLQEKSCNKTTELDENNFKDNKEYLGPFSKAIGLSFKAIERKQAPQGNTVCNGLILELWKQFGKEFRYRTGFPILPILKLVNEKFKSSINPLSFCNKIKGIVTKGNNFSNIKKTKGYGSWEEFLNEEFTPPVKTQRRRSAPSMVTTTGFTNEQFIQNATSSETSRCLEKTGHPECKVCSKSFRTLTGLKLHAKASQHDQIVEEQTDIQCSVCENYFMNSLDVQIHYDLTGHVLENYIYEHEIGKEVCVVCNKNFQRKKQFDKHILREGHEQISISMTNFHCDICDKYFFRQFDYDFHKVHTGHVNLEENGKNQENPAVSKISSVKTNASKEIYTSDRDLETRKTIVLVEHSETKECKTETAEENIENGRRIFRCHMCSKSFDQLYHFYYHVRSPPQCSTCGLRFCDESLMKVHYSKSGHKPTNTESRQKSTHSANDTNGEKLVAGDLEVEVDEIEERNFVEDMKYSESERFSCIQCYAGFKSLQSLKIHVKATGHEQKGQKQTKYRCMKCRQYFRSKWDLNAHKNYFNFENGECKNNPQIDRTCCLQCNVNHKDVESFRLHIETTKHEQISPEKTVYRCFTCGKYFMEKWDLMFHMVDWGHIGDVSPISNEGFQYNTFQNGVCVVCKMKFESLPVLRRHIESTDHQQICNYRSGFKCSDCKLYFMNQWNLCCHMKGFGHFGISNNVINDDTNAKSRLEFHKILSEGMLTSFSNGYYENICLHCSKYYKSARAFARHLLLCNHEEECLYKTDFRCYTCGKYYFRNSDLVCHMTRTRHSGNWEPDKRRIIRRKKNEIVQFECSSCEMTFTSYESMCEHMREKIFCGESTLKVCPIESCNNMRFDCMNSLQVHIARKHSDSYPFKCKECPFVFFHMKNLNSHSSMHKNEAGECARMKNLGKARINAIKHQRKIRVMDDKETLIPDKLDVTQTCLNCSEKFDDYFHPRIHIIGSGHEQMVKEETGFKCFTCDCNFVKFADLELHMDMTGHHGNPMTTGERKIIKFDDTTKEKCKYKCSLCCQVYPNRRGAEGHVRDAKCIRKWYGKCPCCNERFFSRNLYQAHMYRCHHYEFPFKCEREECAKEEFHYLCDFIKHRNFHRNQLPDKNKQVRKFVCEICNKRFWQPIFLSKHRREEHKGAITRVAKTIKESITASDFKCFSCDTCFNTRKALRTHMKQSRHGGLPDQEKEIHVQTVPNEGKEKIRCSRCLHVFLTMKTAEKHVTNATCKVIFQKLCPLCQKMITSRNWYEVHLKGHCGSDHSNKEKSEESLSEHCGFQAQKKKALTFHKKQKHRKRPGLSQSDDQPKRKRQKRMWKANVDADNEIPSKCQTRGPEDPVCREEDREKNSVTENSPDLNEVEVQGIRS